MLEQKLREQNYIKDKTYNFFIELVHKAWCSSPQLTSDSMYMLQPSQNNWILFVSIYMLPPPNLTSFRFILYHAYASNLSLRKFSML